MIVTRRYAMSKERRSYMRLPLSGEIVFGLHDEKPSERGILLNLSQRGLLFETETEVKYGQMVRAVIRAGAATFEPMSIIFVVVRVDKKGPGKYQVSGEITNIDGNDLDLG